MAKRQSTDKEPEVEVQQTVQQAVGQTAEPEEEGSETLSPEQQADLDKHIAETPEKSKVAQSKDTQPLRTLAEILELFGRPIPPRLISQVRKGNEYVSTISWQIVKKYLDFYTPDWELRIDGIVDAGDSVIVYGALGINTSDYGRVWRADVGEQLKKTSKGKDVGFGGASV